MQARVPRVCGAGIALRGVREIGQEGGRVDS